jgi:hypothetical protein
MLSANQNRTEDFMNKAKRYLCGFALLAGLFVIGSLMRSPESQAKGAYSSPVTVLNTSSNPVPIMGAVSGAVPSQPFFAPAFAPFNGNAVVIGTGSGMLAITSITLSNVGPVTNSITIYSQTVGFGLLGACTGQRQGSGQPSLSVLVPPSQTLHLAFPSPLVFKQNGADTCIGVLQTNSSGVNTEVDFNGFVQ